MSKMRVEIGPFVFESERETVPFLQLKINGAIVDRKLFETVYLQAGLRFWSDDVPPVERVTGVPVAGYDSDVVQMAMYIVNNASIRSNAAKGGVLGRKPGTQDTLNIGTLLGELRQTEKPAQVVERFRRQVDLDD